MNRERFIKHQVIFLGFREFIGSDRLDRPTVMRQYKFLDEGEGVVWTWNTATRPKVEKNESYLFSATPLESRATYWPDFDDPQIAVTRGKVYDASAES